MSCPRSWLSQSAMFGHFSVSKSTALHLWFSYVLPFLLDKRRMGKWNNVETGKRETLISIIIAPNFLIYPLTIDVCFQYFTVTNLLGSFPTNFFIFFSNRREIYLLRCLWEMQAGKEALLPLSFIISAFL